MSAPPTAVAAPPTGPKKPAAKDKAAKPPASQSTASNGQVPPNGKDEPKGKPKPSSTGSGNSNNTSKTKQPESEPSNGDASASEFNFVKPPMNGRTFKPDEEQKKQALAVVDEEIKRAKAERDEALRLMNAAKEAGREGAEEKSRLRSAINKLREEVSAARGARDILLQKEKDTKKKQDELRLEEKKLSDNVRFGTIEEIDAEVARLEFKQQTEHLALKDEKTLIATIEKVRASKKLIGVLQAKQAEIKQAAEEKKQASAEANEKRIETTKLQDKLDALKKELAALEPKVDVFAERKAQFDLAAKKVNEAFQKRNAVYAAWQHANELYHQAELERRRLQDEKRKAEHEAAQKAKEEERLAKEKHREAEELAESLKKPWTAEIAKCDALLNYLYKLQGKEAAPPVAPAVATGPSADAKPPKSKRQVEAPSSLKPLIKQEDDYFAPKQATNAAKSTGAPPQQPRQQVKAFSHTLDLIQLFGELSLTPPKGPTDLEANIAQVKAKRDYYDTLPRPLKIEPPPKAEGQQPSKKEATASPPPAAPVEQENKDDIFPQLRTLKPSSAAPATWVAAPQEAPRKIEPPPGL